MSYDRSRVVVIEQNELLRLSYKHVINQSARYVTVGEYETLSEAEQMLKVKEPEVILMDIEYGNFDFYKELGRFRVAYPKIKILIATDDFDSDTIFRIISAGVSGYISKESSDRFIIWALDELIRGGAPLCSPVSRKIVHSFHIDRNSPLSDREREVLNLLSGGHSHPVIAARLFVSPETIKSHVKNIYKKLNVNRKANAIEIARQKKFI